LKRLRRFIFTIHTTSYEREIQYNCDLLGIVSKVEKETPFEKIVLTSGNSEEMSNTSVEAHDNNCQRGGATEAMREMLATTVSVPRGLGILTI